MIGATVLAALVLLAPAAAAAGPGASAQRAPRVSFTVGAEREVALDRVSATLYAQREGRSPAALAAQVNADAVWALERARATAGVEASSAGYRTDPVYDQGRLDRWRVRQSIRVAGADPGTLAALLGALQQRLALQGIDYRLSPATRAAAVRALTGEALDAFSARAGLVAERLGSGYRIVSIDLAGNAPEPVPVRAMGLMARAESAPALAPGTRTVRVTASGTIELIEEQAR